MAILSLLCPPVLPPFQYAFEGAAQLIVISRDLCLPLDRIGGGGSGEVLDGVKDRTWRGRERGRVKQLSQEKVTRRGSMQQERRGESSESENKFSHTLLPGLHTCVKV